MEYGMISLLIDLEWFWDTISHAPFFFVKVIARRNISILMMFDLRLPRFLKALSLHTANQRFHKGFTPRQLQFREATAWKSPELPDLCIHGDDIHKKIEDFQTWIMDQYEYGPTKLRIEANDAWARSSRECLYIYNIIIPLGYYYIQWWSRNDNLLAEAISINAHLDRDCAVTWYPF